MKTIIIIILMIMLISALLMIVFIEIDKKKLKLESKNQENDKQVNKLNAHIYPLKEILIRRKFDDSFIENIYKYSKKISNNFKKRDKSSTTFIYDQPKEENIEILSISDVSLILRFKYKNEYYVLRRVVSSSNIYDKESIVCKEINHPNIMKIYRAESKMEYNGSEFEKITYIISEYLDININFNYVRKDEKIIRDIIKDVAQGLEYLHSKNIAHLDIKISNIMGKRVDGKVIYKIIDFEYSRSVKRYKKREVFLSGKMFGTNGFHPAEVFLSGVHGLKSDVWCLGATAWYLSLGNYHFMGLDNSYMIEYKNFLDQHKIWFSNSTSRNLKDFIKYCMIYDQSERPNIKDVLKHPFLNQI